ncbi:MAG TPA: LptF/LptG family permease [Anaeromyxobacter sp.]|nr:LptF/LptG family permease [Anaeromyxobacter sp.]
MILFAYAARRTLGATLAAMAGVLAIFLAVDFVDNSAGFGGPGWVPAALELYANKIPVVLRMVAPAAMLLGAAISVSTFRTTREYTAMRSLGLGPWRLAVPVLAVTFGLGVALVVLHDVVGVRAEERAEEINALRFGRGGDKRRFLESRAPKRWFRGKDGRRIYNLRGALAGGGFERVTVLEVDPAFRLSRRIDAARMRPDGAGWILDDVEDRTFLAGGEMRVERAPSRRYEFGEPPDAFSVAPGRPSQMRFAALVRQINLRRRLGLPVVDFQLERYNRLAYPLAGVPGALVAVALALRRSRRGHVSSALVESVGVSVAFWAVQGVSFALGLSGRVAPWVAAWAPNALFLAAGLLAVRRTR